jgi:hypothetical protein
MPEAAKEDQKSNDESLADESTNIPAPAARRPYCKPQLRHLGSVRELTAGVGGSIQDGQDAQPPG